MGYGEDDFDKLDREGSAWDTVMGPNSTLLGKKSNRGITILWKSSKDHFGGGGDASVKRCIIDFDQFTTTDLKRIFLNFRVHDILRERRKLTLADYDTIRAEVWKGMQAIKRTPCLDAVLECINSLGFDHHEGNAYRAVISAYMKKVRKKTLSDDRPNRELRQHWLYGMRENNLIGIAWGDVVKNHLIQVAERGGDIKWQELNERGIVHVGIGACRGVERLHELGVIHRDVKPPNVLISRHKIPQIKLIDYSIADLQELKKEGKITKTRTGYFLGTLCYIPPEQRDGKPTELSDVYGLGALLYTLLTGKPPADHSRGIQKSQDPLLVMRYKNQNLAERLRKVIIAAMQPYAIHRYVSARQLRTDLELLQDGKDPEATEIIIGPSHEDAVFCKEDHRPKKDDFPTPDSPVSKRLNNPSALALQAVHTGANPFITTGEMKQPEKRSRKMRGLRALGYTTLGALTLGTLLVIANPLGIGDKIIQYGRQARDQISTTYDSVTDYFKK